VGEEEKEREEGERGEEEGGCDGSRSSRVCDGVESVS